MYTFEIFHINVRILRSTSFRLFLEDVGHRRLRVFLLFGDNEKLLWNVVNLHC